MRMYWLYTMCSSNQPHDLYLVKMSNQVLVTMLIWGFAYNNWCVILERAIVGIKYVEWLTDTVGMICSQDLSAIGGTGTPVGGSTSW